MLSAMVEVKVSVRRRVKEAMKVVRGREMWVVGRRVQVLSWRQVGDCADAVDKESVSRSARAA